MVGKSLKLCEVDHLHYMTHLKNVPSIFEKGIVSYNKARQIPHTDMAMLAVQKRREAVIPETGKQIHEYVPLYFATHTPMQYVITQGTKKRKPVLEQKDLVFIEVDVVRVFRRSGTIFSDGNAAASETRFFTDLSDLDEIDWAIISTPNCYSEEYRRKKAAEVLVPDNVPIEDFVRLVVFCSGYVHEYLEEKAKCVKTKCRGVWPCEILEDRTHYFRDILAEILGN